MDDDPRVVVVYEDREAVMMSLRMSDLQLGAGYVKRLTAFVVLICLALAGPFPAVAAGQSSSLRYPDSYRSRGLPELPGATVIEMAPQTASLRDGVRIRLRSATALAEVRDFYRKTLLEQGWQDMVSPAAVEAAKSNPYAALITMMRGRVTYGATIIASRDSTGTRVTINVRER